MEQFSARSSGSYSIEMFNKSVQYQFEELKEIYKADLREAGPRSVVPRKLFTSVCVIKVQKCEWLPVLNILGTACFKR